MDCHLAVVEGLVRFSDPENSAGRGMWASGRYNQAGKIDGEKPDQKAVKMLTLHDTLVMSLCYVYVPVHEK